MQQNNSAIYFVYSKETADTQIWLESFISPENSIHLFC